MANLPAEVVERIAASRRQSESQLKEDISSKVGKSDIFEDLPTFKSLASALFDAEAAEQLTQCKDAGSFKDVLEHEVAPRVVNGIVPNLIARGVAPDQSEKDLSIYRFICW
jgi:hypothetical protein